MKKIILCTTFRDFTGSENDEIQKLFLQSIASQTYKNFELVVTLFGEKNVERELEKYHFATYFYNHEAGDYRYSLTPVLNNAIEYGLGSGKDFVLLWTTCDVIYDDNFFQEIINASQTNLLGTSHPHATYQCLDDCVNSCNAIPSNLYSGFDLIFFDSKYFDKEVRQILQKYKFYDWGVFEHFLVSLAEVKQRRCEAVGLLNIYETSKIKKIENDRKLTNEPSMFLIKSHERNSITLRNFLRDYNLSRLYFDLTYCHLKFRSSKNCIPHLWTFKSDLLKYKNRALRFYLSQITPVAIKRFFRGGK